MREIFKRRKRENMREIILGDLALLSFLAIYYQMNHNIWTDVIEYIYNNLRLLLITVI